MGKLLIFVAAFQAHLYGLLTVAIGGVVLSIYYYFGWIKAAYFEAWSPNANETPARPLAAPTLVGGAVLATLALVTVLLGFYQEPLTRWLMP
jgi:NADH-quinone oxidoreductase subunit N